MVSRGWHALAVIAPVLLAGTLPACGQNVTEDVHEEREADDEHDDQNEEHELYKLSEKQLVSLHKHLDGNGDGKASLEEVMRFARNISHVMANESAHAMLQGTGHLSLEKHLADFAVQDDHPDNELGKLQLKSEEAKFRAADRNGDNKLDAAEAVGFYHPETNEDVLRVHVQQSFREKDADKDGNVTIREFFGYASDEDPSDEDHTVFRGLDKSGNGVLDTEELKFWESGEYDVQVAMAKLFSLADKDGDQHVTAKELADAQAEINDSNAQQHLFLWALHQEF